MILIGQYDSPFVRRTAIAMELYGMAYEHRPWSSFGDADALAAFNPLRRVPALVLDSGEILIDSAAILDHLDETAGHKRALIAESGAKRRAALKICALATGLADKAVTLFYEQVLHPEPAALFISRCRAQIADALEALDADRAERRGAYWFGQAIGHADITVACVIRHLSEAHPGFFDAARWPSLAAHSARCEALDVFREISQPFAAPT